MSHKIYRFIDPRDHSTFYIGITADLRERFKQHLRCEGANEQKNARIQDILQAGFLPIMDTVEQVETVEEALNREMYWIRHYLQQGQHLLNIVGVSSTQMPKPRSAVLVPEGF